MNLTHHGAVSQHPQMSQCLNCEAPLDSGAFQQLDFCPSCGQSTATTRLTLRDLGSALPRHVLQLDRGLPHTFVALLRSPGGVVRDYLDGRRRRYVNPWAYLLLGAAVSMLVFNLLGGDVAAQLEQAFESVVAERDDLSPSQRTRMLEANRAILQQMTLWSLLMSLPLAVFLRLLFWRSLNLAEAAVFALYLVGHVFFLDLATYLLMPFNDDGLLHVALTQLVYLVAAGWFGATFARRRWLGALQGLAALLLTLIVFAQMRAVALELWLRFG